MTKVHVPSPPEHLSEAAQDLWRSMHEDFDLSDAGALAVLVAALEAFDRMKEAQVRIKAEGLTCTDRFGQEKTNPCVIIERDCRAQFFAGMKQLQLPVDDSGSKKMGRPFGS